MKKLTATLILLFFVKIANCQIVEVYASPDGYKGSQKIKMILPQNASTALKNLERKIKTKNKAVDMLNAMDKEGFKLLFSNIAQHPSIFFNREHYYIFKKE